MDQKPSKALKVFGWIVVILTFLGCYFKVNHWPGSNIMLVLFPLFFLFFYLPLWLVQVWKQKEDRFFVLVQFLFLFVFISWQLLKIMHWPYGSLLGNLMYWGCLFVLLPISLFKLYRFGKSSVFKFNNLILLFYLIAIMQTSLMRSSETSVGTGALAISSGQAESAYKRIKIKSSQLYSAFERLKNKEDNTYFKKAQGLKLLTDSAENYLHHFKTNLLMQLEQISYSEADSLSITKVKFLVNSKIPTAVIVGEDNSKPIKGKFSGSELKLLIERYRDSVMTFVDKENFAFIGSGINLNTADSRDENGERQDWVVANFSYLPAITVLITLTNIEYEIKNAEAQVLSNLLNNASKNSGDDLAARITDLGYKLEAEKKKGEIENLKKDQELSQLKMDAKNSELADRDRAIFYFIIACIAFLILLFYILRSNLLRRQTNRQLQSQKTQIEMQKQEITDSINYAKRIQGAILPPADLIRSVFPESFVLFKPKDIVSGDFYWLQETEKGCFIAAADCTGHGVPGAFMSMIASDKLSESGLFTSDAAQLLKLVNQGIKKALRQSEKEDSTRDGMDIALCFFDKEKKHVEYAGANRPLWVRKNNSAEMTELKATKVAIGGLTENDAEFTKHQVELGKGDLIYLFSDGYADQFSPGDKKLMSRKFKEVLLGMGDKTMMEQKELLEKYFDSWKGNMEQTDDVLVIGIRV